MRQCCQLARTLFEIYTHRFVGKKSIGEHFRAWNANFIRNVLGEISVVLKHWVLKSSGWYVPLKNALLLQFSSVVYSGTQECSTEENREFN